MNIINPLSEQQKQLLTDFLESDSVSNGCLDYNAMHGLLTGVAAGPESLNEKDWMSFLFDSQPQYQSAAQQDEIETIINQLASFIQRNLYLNDDIAIPIPLSAAKSGDTNPLTDWCFGFLEAVNLDEDSWFGDLSISDSIAELILPMGILSNQMLEPELDHLTSNNSIRQQMAGNIVENVQNLYLLYRE